MEIRQLAAKENEEELYQLLDYFNLKAELSRMQEEFHPTRDTGNYILNNKVRQRKYFYLEGISFLQKYLGENFGSKKIRKHNEEKGQDLLTEYRSKRLARMHEAITELNDMAKPGGKQSQSGYYQKTIMIMQN